MYLLMAAHSELLPREARPSSSEQQSKGRAVGTTYSEKVTLDDAVQFLKLKESYLVFSLSF